MGVPVKNVHRTAENIATIFSRFSASETRKTVHFL